MIYYAVQYILYCMLLNYMYIVHIILHNILYSNISNVGDS